MSVYAMYISSLLADSTHMMRLKQMLYLALMMTLTCSLQTRYSLGLRYVCCVCACVCVHACVCVCMCVHACVHTEVTLRLSVWNVRFCAPDSISFPISLYLYYVHTYIDLVFLDCSPPHRFGFSILHNSLAFLQGSIAGTRPHRSGCTNRSGSATYPWSSLGQHFITRLLRTHLLAPNVSQAYEIIYCICENRR